MIEKILCFFIDMDNRVYCHFRKHIWATVNAGDCINEKFHYTKLCLLCRKKKPSIPSWVNNRGCRGHK